MTPREFAAALLAVAADPRLTPDAVRVVLHYAGKGGVGPHPYDQDELVELLEEAGPKRIGRALKRAERHGYLTRKVGGKGHGDSYTLALRPAKTEELKDSSAKSDELKAVSSAKTEELNGHLGGGYMGGEDTTTTNKHTNNQPREAVVENSTNGARHEPPATAELAPLREHLGEFGYAVDVFTSSAPHAGSWPAAVLGKYGPTGTRREFWAGIPPEREPAVLADAMLNYASDYPGKVYQAPLFESLLKRARDGAPAKPPRSPLPGTEHAAVRSSYRGETPGDTRHLHAGAGVPERVMVNIRSDAAKKLGAQAPPEELQREVEERAAAWEKHHGNGTRAIA